MKKFIQTFIRRLKNQRGQGILETELVTIVFFTITIFAIVDLTSIIMTNLRALEAVHMANRCGMIKAMEASGSAQARADAAKGTAQQALLLIMSPFTPPIKVEAEGELQTKPCTIGAIKLTLRYTYMQRVLLPAVIQPIFTGSFSGYLSGMAVGNPVWTHVGSGLNADEELGGYEWSKLMAAVAW